MRDVGEHESSSGSLASRLGRLQGGVEVPKPERSWTWRLVEDFKGLDPGIQRSIIDIVSELQQVDPSRAKETARKISDFFGNTGEGAADSKSIGEFLQELRTELEKEHKKKIQ